MLIKKVLQSIPIVDRLGQKQQDSFKIISEFYHFITTEKLNKNNLVKFAMTNLIEN